MRRMAVPGAPAGADDRHLLEKEGDRTGSTPRTVLPSDAFPPAWLVPELVSAYGAGLQRISYSTASMQSSFRHVEHTIKVQTREPSFHSRIDTSIN